MSNSMKNNDELWNEKYECAKQYYVEKGDLLIPSAYETNEGVKLGMWISKQRQDFKQNKLPKEKIKLLEEIGMVWSVYDAKWFEFYRLATKYYDEKGDLMIPGLYTTSSGVKLGSWISLQRKQYKNGKISKDKIELLEKIGMVWSVYDLHWLEYYKASVEYFNEYGDLLVPLRYKTANNIKLGSWISYQRQDFKQNKLPKDKIELLEKIGMVWDGISATWDEMYKTAKQYYKENENLSISSTRFVYHNTSLGSWILTQRKNYSLGRLSEKQIELLNEIGMEWLYTNNPDYVWEKNYKTVMEFYSKYKHLYIPINFISEDGVRIGVWLHDRKIEYERNELREDRKAKLDKLDKTWLEPINTKTSFPEQAVLFYVRKAFPSATKLNTKEISEIDIYIPELKVGVEYDGPSHKRRAKDDIKKSQKCKKMGIELIRIRDNTIPNIDDDSYKIVLEDSSFDALDKGIIELLHYLNETDIEVNVRRDYMEIADNYIKTIDIDWYLMYEKLKEYFETYGNINVPINYKTSDGTQLGHWLSNIRSSYKNPQLGNVRLNSNKINLLNELGMDWSPIETQWQNKYLLAKQYYEENGHLLLQNQYITDENIKLGKWIGTQRYNFKKGKLSREKKLLLEKIGMIWDVADYEWMKMYDLAEIYYKENGDLLVPGAYKTKESVSLGAWIAHQRKNYRENKMPNKRRELLSRIGMVWNLH